MIDKFWTEFLKGKFNIAIRLRKNYFFWALNFNAGILSKFGSQANLLSVSKLKALVKNNVSFRTFESNFRC